VIVCDDKKVDDTTLLEAATIGATYSNGKDSSKVEVDYTQVKNVKRSVFKKPGMVFYTSQKTIIVSPNQTLCQKLLKSKN
jgi:predicted ribosome quality control (RQC) complex YloA/Tae2 family protein